jgi:hypothetical protein
MPLLQSADPQQQALERETAAARGPYDDASAAEENLARLRFRMTGEADPQLPARVLALLTVKGELPLQFVFNWRQQDEGIELRFELQADTVMYPEQLLDRLLKLPTVREASLLPPAWEP